MLRFMGNHEAQQKSVFPVELDVTDRLEKIKLAGA